MKLLHRLPFLIISILALAGCVLTGETIKPTQMIQTPSPRIILTSTSLVPTPTLISTTTAIKPTSTLPSTITPTPVDTLEPETAKATIEPLIREPLNCAVPCFWGIIPGKTQFNDAKTFFSHLGFTPFEGINPNSGRYFYSIAYESSIGRRSNVSLILSDQLVTNIIITPDIVKQKEGSPREWIAYSPETLIQKYGKPSSVRFALDWGPNFVITMILYFDDSDLIALYSGYNMIPGRPHSPRLCPLTAPFDLVRLWMGSNPPDPPLTGSPDPLETSVPLEKVTTLTIDQFTQLMLGDPKLACFTINGNAFQ
jgi:hypothetical protein